MTAAAHRRSRSVRHATLRRESPGIPPRSPAKLIAVPQVMTVTGPVDAEQLGVVLPHEHIYLNLMAEDREVGLLNDERLMIEELDLFVRAGGRTLCEVTSNGIDRQPEKLRHAAVATGLNIIMGSGWYRHPYLDLAYFDRH